MYNYREEIEREYGEPERSRRLAFFDAMVADGNTPQFAAMCACNSPPGTKGSDRAFTEGGQNQFDRMYGPNRDRILQTARSAGVDISGKRYISGLGKPDNPLAWVSNTSDLLHSCKVQGKSCTGAVNYQAPEQEAKSIPLAEDFIQEEANRRCAADPALVAKLKKNPKAKKELREAIIDRHGPKKK